MPSAPCNLLPCDGSALYFGPVFAPLAATTLFDSLLHQIPWAPDSVRLFGKTIVTARKVAWVADQDLPYAYSGTAKQSCGWSPLLRHLLETVQTLAQHPFNSCLLNLYHSGSEGMSWHSDDESSLHPLAPIASLSFGAARKFSFKHRRTQQTLSLLLEPGSLLLMSGPSQTHWLHCLPKSKRVLEPRINLTFRQMLAP
jgi:alkylated DNA repair dioxygenase AlkB